MTKNFKLFFIVLADLVILYLSLIITTFLVNDFKIDMTFLNKHIYAFSFLFPLWLIVFYIQGLYSLRFLKVKGLAVSLLQGVNINTIISFIFFYFFKSFGISPKINMIVFIFTALTLLYLGRRFIIKSLTSSNLFKNVIIITKSNFEELQQELKKTPLVGLNLVKISKTLELDDLNIKDIEISVVDNNVVEDNSELKKYLDTCVEKNIAFYDLASFYEEVTGKISLNAMNSYWLLEKLGKEIEVKRDFIKRAFDLLGCGLIVIFAFPILFIFSFLQLIVEGRPIFYSQERVGKKGKSFTIYKLRTMIVNAEVSGAQWASAKDNRITKLGKFLRLTRIDELPQLYNILKGDMSLVGPRPERPEIIKSKLKNLSPYYDFRHLVLPGVTGWAQVNYKYGSSEEDTLKKLQYDLFYVKNRSLWLDIRIILKTIHTVLTAAGR